MSITLIDNQAIRFRLLSEIESDTCGCYVKPYCQKVNKFDVSKYQIISNTVLSNGDFSDELEGWEIEEPINISVEITNESQEGECDGELVITASGGTGPYEYSIDGITFQGSDTFSSLCVGCYSITVKDANDSLGFSTACIDTNVDCSIYSSPDLFDLVTTDLSKLINCELNDLI